MSTTTTTTTSRENGQRDMTNCGLIGFAATRPIGRHERADNCAGRQALDWAVRAVAEQWQQWQQQCPQPLS